MEKISIIEWLDYVPGSDQEANCYRLLAILSKVNEIAVDNKEKALGILKDMILDIEAEHLTYFEDPYKLHHIKMGKYIVSIHYMMLKHKDKCMKLDLIAETQIWKKIKSPAAV